MVRIGIVGTGNTIGISKNHAMAYAKCDDAKITAVYDVLPGLGEQFLEKMGLTEAVSCASYEELLSLCDAVSICTPNCTHIDLTVQALKAGKHVLCEKPFAPTPEECDEAIRYAKLTGKVAMIGLCYRDYPGLRFLKKLVDDGTLGRIFFARLAHSCMLSSDVSSAFDPTYASSFDKKNVAYLGGGMVINKFTGARGKSGSNDANAEYLAHLRHIFDKAEVNFQTAELGKVDLGGGGTIAYILALYGMNVIDSGVAVLNMHAPWEATSKADVYETYRGYKAFVEGASL